MESGVISNGQISASSEYDADHAANHGRLNYQGEYAAWSSRTLDANQWLQIDLISHHIKITRIATQGRDSDKHHQWVTKYKLQYSNDEVTFKHYREQGQNVDKVRYISLAKTRDLMFLLTVTPESLQDGAIVPSDLLSSQRAALFWSYNRFPKRRRYSRADR